MRIKGSLTAAVAMSILTGAAVAQTNHVAWSKIETGSWVMHPLYTEDAGGAISVSNFLALTDPVAAVGDNLVAVWYRREGASWTAKSWSTNDPWEAIKSVKAELGISDDEDDRWDISGDDDFIPTAEAPEEYVSGVLADDPLAPLIASSPDRDVIVELLAITGYQAADVPVEKDDGCTTDAKLDGMAAAIVETLQGDEETAVDRSMAAWIASGTAGCGAPVAVIIVEFPPQYTPWVPGLFECEYEPFDSNSGFCTEARWTETRTVTERRTRAMKNWVPPPTYLYCDQTRTGTQTRTLRCTDCQPLTYTPCPVAEPPSSPMPTACFSGWSGGISSSTVWGAWTPACPF